MKNSNVPQRNTISNKMKIDLDVFHALMLNWIHGHVDNTHVVPEDNSDNNGTQKGAMELLEELS
jgi:hypothetical protein